MKYIIPLVIFLAACSESTVEEIARKEVDRATLELAKEGKAAIADLSKDPESAKFRKLKVYNQFVIKDLANIPEGEKLSGLSALCGEVNMKNKYGAYIGYKKFHYSSGDAVVLGESSSSLGKRYEKLFYEQKCSINENGEITDIAP
jgi:hypothetical protein